MDKLTNHWFSEGYIDFEYKKYILLAYLQKVDAAFEKVQLYPHLGELVRHYRVLEDYLQRTEEMEAHFPKRIDQIELDNFRLSFRQVMQDDELMEEIKAIVSFSRKEVQSMLKEGQQLYEWLEKHFNLSEIGLSGLYHYEGFLLTQNGGEAETKAYRYQLSRIEGQQDPVLKLQTEYLTSFTISGLLRNYSQLKQRLMRQFRHLADCATFAVESEWTLPERETFIPIARRLLLRRLSTS